MPKLMCTTGEDNEAVEGVGCLWAVLVEVCGRHVRQRAAAGVRSQRRARERDVDEACGHVVQQPALRVRQVARRAV